MDINQYITCKAGRLWKAVTSPFAKKILPEEVCQHCWYKCEHRTKVKKNG